MSATRILESHRDSLRDVIATIEAELAKYRRDLEGVERSLEELAAMEETLEARQRAQATLAELKAAL